MRKNKEGQLPLHIACMNRCDIESIRILLKPYPSSVRATDYKGITPMQYMRSSTHPNQQAILSVMERALASASSHDSIGISSVTVSTTIANSNSMMTASPSVRSAPSLTSKSVIKANPPYTNSSQYSTLHLLLLHQRYDKALDHIADCPHECTQFYTVQDGDGTVWTSTLPLHLICSQKSPTFPLVKRLLQVCNSSNVPDEGGHLPLHLLCEHGIGYVDVNVVRLLIKVHKSAVYMKDKLGMLPIHCAVWGCPMYKANLGSSDVNDTMNDAVSNNVSTILSLLLRYNPGGLNARDKFGRTPIQIAQLRNSLYAVEFLTSYQGNENNFASGISTTLSNASSLWTTGNRSVITNATLHQSIATHNSNSNALLYAISHRQWESIPYILQSQPELARQCKVVSATNTSASEVLSQLLPLHLALQKSKVPGSVVNALISAYPESARLTRASDGALPLHIALSHECTLDVIEVLLRAYPIALTLRDDRGRLPCDYYYASLNASSTRYNNERKDMNFRDERIGEALRRDVEYWKSGNPQAAPLPTKRPNNHSEVITSDYLKNDEEFKVATVSTMAESFQNKQDIHQYPPQNKGSSMRDYIRQKNWDALHHRCQTNPKEACDWLVDNNSLPLHELCKMQPSALVMQDVLRAYPQAVRCSERCPHHRLPLHIAVEHRADIAVIDLLYEAFPAAVHTKDGRGMLPLHCACEIGCEVRLVKKLVDWYPTAVEEVDQRGRAPLMIVLEGDAEDKIGILEVVQQQDFGISADDDEYYEEFSD